jgi:hypothetical protein
MQGKNNTLQEHDLQVEKINLNCRERVFFAVTIQHIELNSGRQFKLRAAWSESEQGSFSRR